MVQETGYALVLIDKRNERPSFVRILLSVCMTSLSSSMRQDLPHRSVVRVKRKMGM